jgi:hypothetical protein
MWFFIYAAVAIAIIISHYTGWLERHNLSWLVFVLAATIIPAVIWL